ncbi:hypothetical protein [Salipiger sp. PrR002]|uniref:hypothetical protein n=1 Tax=Salipiger sp. PrR002 TaxID=2706489 RepID=UPI0013BAF1F3|nr:hypothetical protein [Salipiger sp. PrR002]NDV99360.1 hypothetical protein [Salipiger sp. PrR002]NDW55846.1 hypothetical protein [Salipiger sp. PrR004]
MRFQAHAIARIALRHLRVAAQIGALAGPVALSAQTLWAGGAPAARQDRALAAPAADEIPLVVPAGAIGYLCRIHVPYSQRWIPPVLFIAHDPETGRVIISDPIALSYNFGLPVLGKVASDSTRRISFTWDYPVGSGAQQTRRMLYRAGFDKRSGEVVVTAIPAGFDRVFQASGICEGAPLNELAAQP